MYCSVSGVTGSKAEKWEFISPEMQDFSFQFHIQTKREARQCMQAILSLVDRALSYSHITFSLKL
jgi:hypothetical protein